MHGAMKRHEIQVLRRAGQTLRQIAAQAGVSISTIKRILKDHGIQPAQMFGSDDSRWSRTNYYVMHRALSIFLEKKRVGLTDPPLFGNLHKQPFVLEEEITNPVVVWSHR